MADEPTNGQTVRVEHTAAKTDNDKTASVPSFRLREESERRRQAESKLNEVSAELEQLRSEFVKASNSLQHTQTTHSQDMHLFELGFKAPSVRRFLRREYTDSTAEIAADSRPSFADWLDANRADPLYSVHFDRLNGAAPAAAPATAPEPTADPNAELFANMRRYLEGNPNAGTSQPAAHTGRDYSVDELAAIRGKSNGTLGQHKDSILNTLRAEGLIK
jgi:hypothetical protein